MRKCLVLLMLLALPSLAGDVLTSGNTFNTSDATYMANIALLPHTFTHVAQVDLADTDLTGYTTVWLDGFSSFENLPSDTLSDFVAAGGVLLVQNPGFGGNPLSAYPFGEELSATFTEDGPVVVSDAGHAVNAGLSDALLSNWIPSARAGFFSQNGDFSAVSHTGTSEESVTLVRAHGGGLIIYTQQTIGQTLDASSLSQTSGPLIFLNNIFASNEPLAVTPPLFVRANQFWRDGNGDLLGNLPAANSDGLDPDGQANLTYEISLIENGQTVYGPLSPLTSPTSLTIDAANIPKGPYYIGVARRGETTSAPLLLNGPATAAENPGIARLYRRWLLHLPRQAGGFSGIIRLENPHLEEAVTLTLVSFRSDGSKGPVATRTVDPSGRVDYPLYGTNGLFPQPEDLDTLSHLAVWDPTGATHASLRYQADISGFGVWVREQNLSYEPISGSLFRVDGATPSAVYYDGVAVLNLSSALTPEVVVRRYDSEGNAAGELSLGQLAPAAKVTSALSFAFEGFVANPSYQVEAVGDGDMSIQVLGLSGSTDGTFFANALVTRMR